MSGISKMLLIVFVLFILQALGGWYQIQNYRKAMRRVHQYGNVGFGQRKGRLTAGYIIMIACDHDGIITRCEIMQGLSFLAKFKPLNEFLGKDMKGRSIYEFLDDMKDFDKKQKKKYFFQYFFFIYYLLFLSVFLAKTAGTTTAYITLAKIDKLIYCPSTIAPKNASSIALTTKNNINIHP